MKINLAGPFAADVILQACAYLTEGKDGDSTVLPWRGYHYYIEATTSPESGLLEVTILELQGELKDAETAPLLGVAVLNDPGVGNEDGLRYLGLTHYQDDDDKLSPHAFELIEAMETHLNIETERLRIVA